VGWIWADVAQAALAKSDAPRAQAAAREVVKRRPKILRWWNLAVRVAWHVGDPAFLRELRSGIDALPAERARFGRRLLDEAKLQCDAFAAMQESRWDDAERILRQGLEDASRDDDFACTMVSALGEVLAARGDRDEAARLLAGGGVGPHGTKRCDHPDCADVARLAKALDQSKPPSAPPQDPDDVA